MIKEDVEKFKKFYPLWIEKVGRIALQHGCDMLRSFADFFNFSFPLKSNLTDVSAIRNVLECLFEQLEVRSIDMGGQQFQEISCRICADYGTCSEWEPGDEEELGPGVSLIDRIRWRVPAQANTIIVGDEFYKVIESFPILHEQYLLERKGEIVIDKVPYPAYQLSRRCERSD
jgi:hypothetical protein